jgi:hypothetical protein
MLLLKNRITTRTLNTMSWRHVFELLNQTAGFAGDQIHASFKEIVFAARVLTAAETHFSANFRGFLFQGHFQHLPVIDILEYRNINPWLHYFIRVYLRTQSPQPVEVASFSSSSFRVFPQELLLRGFAGCCILFKFRFHSNPIFFRLR